MKRFRRKAFTLIEVLMVVIIMAVLAATIIPQFSTSSRDAKLSVLKYNLRILRSQLESYKVQHSGVYPPAAASTNLERQLTQKTDRNTALDAANGACGPYIGGEIPINPFNQSTAWRSCRATRSRAARPAALTAGSTIRSTAGSIRTTSSTFRARAVSPIRIKGFGPAAAGASVFLRGPLRAEWREGAFGFWQQRRSRMAGSLAVVMEIRSCGIVKAGSREVLSTEY